MEHLPPWLRNVPLPPRPAGRGEAAAPPPAPPPGAGDDEMPSWLIELQGEVADDTSSRAEPGATPDWLVDLAPPAGGAEAPPARSEAFADAAWLTDPAADGPPAVPTDQGDQQSTNSRIKMPVGATDWLRSIGQDPDARSEPLSEPISTPEDQSGVPEWLRDLTADDVARGIAAEAPDSQPRFDPQVPGWLADDLPGPDASTVSANFRGQGPVGDETADDVPDWLQAAAGPAAAEPSPPRRDEPQSADLASSAEMPAWLRDLGEEAPAVEEPSPDDEPAWLRDAANRPPTDRLAAEEVEVPAWLLGSDEPATPEPAPAADDDEMPSWLREAPPTAGASTGAAAPPPRDDGPAWLQDAAAQPGADEVPAWLREAEPPASTGGAWPAAEPQQPGADEVPAWLREAERPAAGGDEPGWLQEPAASVSPDEVPAWLREAEPAPPPASQGEAPSWLDGPAAPAPTPPADEEVPAWLRSIDEAPPAPPAGDVPAWLQDDAAGPAAPNPTWLRDALAEPEAPPAADAVPAWLQGDVPPPPPPRGDLPPWLTDDSPAGAPAEGPGQPAGPASLADPGLPSWLRGVADEAPPAGATGRPASPPPKRAVPSAEQGDSHSFLSGTDLPSWLRVPEPERPSDPGEGQALDWLRRLGGPEAEEDAQAAAVAAVAAPQRPIQQRSAEQLAAVGLLQRITRAPYPEPAVPVAAAPLTRWQRIGLDRVLYALLAIALLVALVVPALTAPLQTTAPVAPGAAELSELLDSLGPEDVALVAYEWGAQRSGELRPLEEAVSRRLIATKTKLIMVSTDLQGTLLSFDLVGPLRAAGYNNEGGVSFGGRDYVLLGYRPGGELALRRLAQDLRGELRSDFDGQDATQGLVANNADGTPRFNGINDLSMILVLADQPQDVQAWMEQVRPAARDVPIVFVLPQEAQPQAQPYLRLPKVYHVAGLQGALAIAAGDPTSDPAALAQDTGQLWFSVVAFLVLLAGGAVAAVVGRRRSPREVPRER